MKLLFKTSLIFIFFTFSNVEINAQEITGVRYKMTSNFLLNFIKDFPNKKSEIEATTKNKTPKYVDYILFDNSLIQNNWGHDNELMGSIIYSLDKKKIYYLSKDNKMKTEKISPDIDTLFMEAVDNILIFKTDTLNCLKLSEKEAFPLKIFLKDSLNIKKNPFQKRINHYPEISFVMEYKIYPKVLIFGAPKRFMTYEFSKNLNFNSSKLKNSYTKFLEKPNSKKRQQNFVDVVMKNRPTANSKANNSLLKLTDKYWGIHVSSINSDTIILHKQSDRASTTKLPYKKGYIFHENGKFNEISNYCTTGYVKPKNGIWVLNENNILFYMEDKLTMNIEIISITEDVLMVKYKKINLKITKPGDNLKSYKLSPNKIDTTLYESGEIKLITLYQKTTLNSETRLITISGYKLLKEVFQYDKCGNLRNITEIKHYSGPIESCHDYYFNNPYLIKDNFIKNIDCKYLWTKPILFYGNHYLFNMSK